MYTDTAAHASGCLQMNTGSVLIGKPSLGSWLSYGLGTENENLPSFVVMTDPRGGPIGGASNWTRRLHAGRLPGHAVPQRGHARCSTWPRPPAPASARRLANRESDNRQEGSDRRRNLGMRFPDSP